MIIYMPIWSLTFSLPFTKPCPQGFLVIFMKGDRRQHQYSKASSPSNTPRTPQQLITTLNFSEQFHQCPKPPHEYSWLDLPVSSFKNIHGLLYDNMFHDNNSTLDQCFHPRKNMQVAKYFLDNHTPQAQDCDTCNHRFLMYNSHNAKCFP